MSEQDPQQKTDAALQEELQNWLVELRTGNVALEAEATTFEQNMDKEITALEKDFAAADADIALGMEEASNELDAMGKEMETHLTETEVEDDSL